MSPADPALTPIHNDAMANIEDWSQPEVEDDTDRTLTYDHMPPEDKKALHDSVGQTLARQEGAALLLEMIRKRDLTLAQIQDSFGYAPKVLSELTNQKSVGGPKLATLISVADALGFDVDIHLVDRTEG